MGAMKIERLAIPDVLLLHAPKRGDHRGFFSETFRQDVFDEAGVDVRFIQDNFSFSAAKGVVRGLHWQTAPAAQAKLVRCYRGAILDVVVDIRRGSPTYGQHVSAELSRDNWVQIYVPVGFAHGFCTLTEDCEVAYKVTAPYAPDCEGGLRWNDPALGISWPLDPANATLSQRDTEWPAFDGFVSPFSMG
jgi:dTDP-4-dehydrorhamnose 3,5-epimerase